MGKTSGGFSFAKEPVAELFQLLFLVDVVQPHRLDRDRTLDRRILAQVDHPHGTAPQFLENLVSSQRGGHAASIAHDEAGSWTGLGRGDGFVGRTYLVDLTVSRLVFCDWPGSRASGEHSGERVDVPDPGKRQP